MSNPNQAYWDTLTLRYQELNRISVEDYHYGPLVPGDKELCLLPMITDEFSALELGCGAGQNSIYLSSKGASCFAMDISHAQLAHGSMLCADVNFIHHDMDNLNWPCEGPFDLIHGSFALPFSENPAAIIKKAARLLKDDGTLLFSIGHPLYSGEWLEISDNESGVFFEDYFNLHSDVRVDDEGAESASHYYTFEESISWFRDAGLVICDIREPKPLQIKEMTEEEIHARVPYDSDAWRDCYDEISRVPFVLILKAVKHSTVSDLNSP